MNAEALSGKVLGTCTLQKLLGRGGMGAVFLSQQSRPRRQVAVKVLLPISALQPRQRAAFLERFRRETDAAASLEHPNIVPVHEYGEQDGLAYLVMAYISGGTLRDELEREGKLSLIQTVSYLDQMADALDFAHERGVIHRDIKPANILLTPEKRLLLTDFGLVKIVTDEQRDQKQLSEAGMPLGTPDYMSPEQVVGREIDARADLYSLGVILFQMVTGSVPFKGEMPMKVAMHHLHTPPPSPRTMRPDLPLAAEAVILRALAKNPEDRYAHTPDFANAFRQALEAAGVVLADAPGSTAAVRAMNVDRNASNRPRGLFDPVWRGDQGHQSPQVKDQPQEETAKLAMKQATHAIAPASPALAVKETTKSQPQRGQQKPVSGDIVAKTSMTLPSFSGILSPTMANQHVSSLLAAQSALATSSTDTPLSDINMMEDQPTNELPRQNNRPAKDANTSRNAPTRNSLLSPNRLRPQGKTNLLGEEQRNGASGGNGMHNSNPTAPQQPNMASPAENVAQPISPSTYTTSTVNPNGKTGQLRSYANNNVKLIPDAQPAPNVPDMPHSSNSTRQLNPLPGTPENGPNYTVPLGPAGSTGTLDAAQQNFYQPGVTGTYNNINAQAGMAGTTGSFNLYNPSTGTTGVWKTQTGALIPVNAPGATGSFMVPSGNESTGQTGMLKLTQPVKVIKVPLAGQPGQYVTGLLPVLPSSNRENEWSKQPEDTSLKGRLQKNMKALILIAAVVVILFGSVIFLVNRPSAPTPTVIKTVPSAKANKAATAAALASRAAAQASATAQANLIVNDPLSTNSHGWLNGNDKVGNSYAFQNGAYHVKVANDQNEAAVALLPNPSGLDNFVYTVSLNEVDGLDNSTDAAKVNAFGLVFRFTNGTNLSYYAFLIDPNSAKPTYEFQKYDKLHENNNDARTSLWSGSIGSEYHLNHGTNNIIKITANGTHFNFNVNGKDVGSKDDNSFGSGQVGMIVNLNGTEIAFSNLLLTHQ
jgi:eukaryotic-like serine/threonine-protein kinase